MIREQHLCTAMLLVASITASVAVYVDRWLMRLGAREEIARQRRLDELMGVKVPLSEEEVGKTTDKLDECPLCGCNECEVTQMYCFHCADCSYLQCCDWGGFYEKARKRMTT